MCQIVALTSEEEIPCLAGCKICDKDDCRDTLIHPVTGIRMEFETETSSTQEDQHDMNSFVWSKLSPTSSVKLKPIHDPKPPLSRTRDVKYWTPEEFAVVALNYYNEAARLSKASILRLRLLTSSNYRGVRGVLDTVPFLVHMETCSASGVNVYYLKCFSRCFARLMSKKSSTLCNVYLSVFQAALLFNVKQKSNSCVRPLNG